MTATPRTWKSRIAFSLLVVAMWAVPFSGLHAQVPSKWLEKAKQAHVERSYLQAIEYYAWSLKQDSSLAAIRGIAECKQELGDYRGASQWWKSAAKHPQAGADEFFRYGRSLLCLSRPDEAARWFAKYHQLAPDDPTAATYKDVETWLPDMFRDSALFSVSRIRSNSKYSDFGATFFEEGILFCSNRPNNVAVVHASASDGLPLVDMYYSKLDEKKGYSPANSVNSLNTRFHEGPAFFSAATNTLYLTRATQERPEGSPKGSIDQLAIFIYKYVDGNWVANGEVPSSGYSIGHPALTPDGKWLYFTSDRPGGLGGTDIWKIENQGGAWGNPINLGAPINTLHDESYPSFQSDGVLFFSSEGHPGLGGLDIFMSRANAEGNWNRPINPGVPVNSTKDDFNYLPKGDGNQGLLCSNRNQAQEDDIFEFKRTQPSFECQPQQENNYCFRFWETGSIETDTMPLYYAWDMGDGVFHRGLEVNHCFAGPGDYIVQLNLIDSVSGYTFLNEATYEMNIRDIVQPFIEGPDTAKVYESAVFEAKKSTLENCESFEYFWDFGDGGLAKGITAAHTWRLPGQYEIKLGVTGSIPGSSEGCKSCVTRTIHVLEPKQFKRIQDSTARAREANPFNAPDANDRKEVLEIDSTGKALLDIRDSSEVVFKVQLKQSKVELPANDPIFEVLKNKKAISVVRGDSSYTYTYGEENTRDKIYPFFEEVKQKGMQEALVVAFKNDKAISGSDSTFSVRIPIQIAGDKVILFSGNVKDSKGNPLQVEITMEDLMNKVEVVRVKTGTDGGFQLKLPDGRIYGYYLDAPGYFPYSDFIDLRGNSNAEKDVVIKQTLTMQSIKEILELGTAVRINNIFFDYDKDVLKPESMPELRRLSEMLREEPKIKLEILGHTDSEGDDAYNIGLSKRRADSVAQYLKSEGLGARVIRTIGYGETLPLTNNDTPVGRQQNRRVEFRLIKY